MGEYNYQRDLTGKRVGQLTILNKAGKDGLGLSLWLCKCDCGNEKVLPRNWLLNNGDCGCITGNKGSRKLEIAKQTGRLRANDLTGQTFGRLLIVERAGSDGEVLWKYVCSCGNTGVTRAYYLRSGQTKSCGCLKKEVASERGKITGREFKVGGFYLEERKEAIRKRAKLLAQATGSPYAPYELHDANQLALQRDSHTCKICGSKGLGQPDKRNRRGLLVHHIYPRNDFPEFACFLWNLVTLCFSCHRTVHANPKLYPEMLKGSLY